MLSENFWWCRELLPTLELSKKSSIRILFLYYLLFIVPHFVYPFICGWTIELLTTYFITSDHLFHLLQVHVDPYSITPNMWYTCSCYSPRCILNLSSSRWAAPRRLRRPSEHLCARLSLNFDHGLTYSKVFLTFKDPIQMLASLWNSLFLRLRWCSQSRMCTLLPPVVINCKYFNYVYFFLSIIALTKYIFRPPGLGSVNGTYLTFSKYSLNK